MIKLFPLFLLLVCINYGESASTIKYAAVLYRHGDRTPINPYPNDPYRNESLWPDKFGELTNLGTLQHYRLGQWLKNRYEHLLSKQYDPTEIYIRSTDTDRTISSALANLAGMFPASGKSVWNEDLLWRPIPVHTVPSLMDEILGDKKPCPAYDESLNNMKNSKSYREELLKYKPLMKYLSDHTGTTVNDYEDIEYIYSTLKIETEHNFTLPSWTTQVFPSKMEKPACHSFTVPTLKANLARIKAGPLLKDIVDHMIKAAQNNSTLKLSIYSAHDNNVANFLNALNIFDEHCPHFTATVIVELVEDTDLSPQIFVRILYKNSAETVEPQVLHIPYCGQTCPFDRFISLYQYLILVNWETDCTLITYFMILLWLSLFLLLAAVWHCKCYYCGDNKAMRYQHDYNASRY